MNDGRAKALGRTGPPGHRADYELVELLPQTGGQAFVFRAVLHGDRLDVGAVRTDVSLKQLITGAVGTSRTDELVGVLQQRAHPNLSRILEVFSGPAPVPSDRPGDDDALVYVASEWVPGCTVDEAAVGASLSAILRWVTQIAAAVDFLHAARHDGGPLCHRDIKPANVIVTPGGDAVLIDPGLARLVANGATGTPHGSPGFIPPEYAADPLVAGTAGDRWQVGALLYTLLVGERPGRADPATLRRRLRAARRWHLSQSFVDGLLQMLDPVPERRPESALRWALDLRTDSARLRIPPLRRPSRRVALTSAGTLLIVGAAAAGWFAHGPSTASASATPGVRSPGFLPDDSLAARRPGVPSRAVTVYNKVTSGPHLMREDDPAYLSTIPSKFCALDGCQVSGTDMFSGVKLTATCQTSGASTTNGDDTNDDDAKNPGRYTSSSYYGIRLPDGRSGYLSFVWVVPADRDGLGLPECRLPG